jgi:hypothetical protein
MMEKDASPGLQYLLDLNGEILDQGDGYWIKIDAWEIPPSRDVPHGVRYSLSLHEPYGNRIFGHDNAHATKPPKKFKFAGQKLPYDHKHRHASDKGVPYVFVDAAQLLNDFFAESDVVLAQHRLRGKP